ncbi:hypothetical protein [Leptospira kmetyi]|uniref:DUF4870 domain-containing protein n=1 Tax=Leptospira kmetyi TaxID=408139 RepID=A0A2M9XPN8_9LEPT|nr:hypothetical protein [Leptospira kmetyi]AYV56032.1 hypothetical protein EFP84_11270 [Leptospira kmetyi]EQA54565.1 hypothetical protein LEP1GSC052_3645 [Leptospira kmetyi serovar Malaysia str. Bejo-Iso9]PJZ31439.1 hypothetical protein CH378_02845 [Leptospira kmetyi]PJZ41133.1 hypothetical protein CH370_12890 [Leptospira kmetyi]TGK16150.1 hypothetical protein EHO62_10360 [Leptospira kmetyi]
MKFKEYLKKYEPVLRNLPETTNRFLRSERFLVYLVSLPLFGTWLIGFTFYWENQTVRKYSGLSFINFLYFLGFLLGSVLVSWIPLAGPWLGHIVHLAGILIYLGISGLLLYNYTSAKKIALRIPEEHLSRLESYIH